MRDEIAIVGNNLAALVTAQSLATHGAQVILINPAASWGGHFAGLELASRRFDAGMVLYEFCAFNSEPAPDLQGYDPSVRNDSGRFVGTIRDYVARRVATALVPDPLMYFGGRLYPDMIIANRVESLAMFDSALRGAISAELETICRMARHPMHASRKTHEQYFGKVDFESVSNANHGRALHKCLLEPLCHKIMAVPPKDILALYHRTAWLPLYYPETLLSQFGAVPQRLPATQFHYPIAGSAGALVRTLAAETLALPGIRIVRSRIARIHAAARVTIEFADGGRIEPAELVWTLDPGALIALADEQSPRPPYARASIGLCFIAIPAPLVRAEFSTLFVIDPKRAIYRVSDQEVCAGSDAQEHRIVAEFSPAALDIRVRDDQGVLRQTLLQELAELGIIDAPGSVAYCSVKILPSALMIPNHANRAAYNGEREWLSRRLPSIHLAGLSAGFLAASMNDQIVQGLQLGTRLAFRGR